MGEGAGAGPCFCFGVGGGPPAPGPCIHSLHLQVECPGLAVEQKMAFASQSAPPSRDRWAGLATGESACRVIGAVADKLPSTVYLRVSSKWVCLVFLRFFFGRKPLGPSGPSTFFPLSATAPRFAWRPLQSHVHNLSLHPGPAKGSSSICLFYMATLASILVKAFSLGCV